MWELGWKVPQPITTERGRGALEIALEIPSVTGVVQGGGDDDGGDGLADCDLGFHGVDGKPENGSMRRHHVSETDPVMACDGPPEALGRSQLTRPTKKQVSGVSRLAISQCSLPVPHCTARAG